MMTTIVAAVFILGIVIIFHELGHFWAAKKGGVRVERFSLGFPPKLISFKKGETEYIISVLPFGGYVKMAGDTPEELKGEPWEFLSSSVWTRTKIVLSGPLLNFVLAIVVFSLLYMMGMPTMPNQIGKIEKNSPSEIAGLMVNDKIIKVDGKPTNDWTEVMEAISKHPQDTKMKLTLLRGNEEIEKEVKAIKQSLGISPYVSTEIKTVIDDSPAYKAGIRPDDIITSINNRPVWQWDEMTEIIQANPNKELILGLKRGEENLSLKVRAEAKASYDLEAKKEIKIGAIGITSKLQRHRLNPIMAIWAGLMKTLEVILITFAILFQLLSGVLPFKLIAGPIGIIQMTGQQAQLGFLSLFSFMAFISVNLGVVNLLPLPILDGGHAIFLLLEKIRKKPLSLKAQTVVQWVGMSLLVSLIILVSYNDILRWIGHK